MSEPRDYSDLEKRLREAMGPDRECDLELWCLTRGHTIEWRDNRAYVANDYRMGDGAVAFIDPTPRSRNFYLNSHAERIIPAYTSSLDAITDLIVRNLAGWRVQLFQRDEGWNARLIRHGPYAIYAGDDLAMRPSAALALCPLFVQALAHQQLLSRERASQRQLPSNPLPDDPANGDENAPGDAVKRGFD